MDPNEALRQLRTAITTYRVALDPATARDAADRMADHADALDQWLTQGGFPPTAWRQVDQ
jgi:hypothetical protein